MAATQPVLASQHLVMHALHGQRLTNTAPLICCPQSLNDERMMRMVFEEFGPLLSVTIARGQQGYSKGFGFVEFKRSDHAEA